MSKDYNTPARPAHRLASPPGALDGALGPEALIECLLFVADGPVPIAHLAQALDLPPREVEAALAALASAYEKRGLRLQRWQDRAQLTTSPAAAAYVERFLGLQATVRLTHAALETLAIVAYQQPATRPQIEAVRGVNSDSVIKSLLAKDLIEEIGRSEGVGRPILYRTTPEFLQYFGLLSLAELPPLTLPAASLASPPLSSIPTGDIVDRLSEGESGEPLDDPVPPSEQAMEEGNLGSASPNGEPLDAIGGDSGVDEKPNSLEFGSEDR